MSSKIDAEQLKFGRDSLFGSVAYRLKHKY